MSYKTLHNMTQISLTLPHARFTPLQSHWPFFSYWKRSLFKCHQKGPPRPPLLNLAPFPHQTRLYYLLPFNILFFLLVYLLILLISFAYCSPLFPHQTISSNEGKNLEMFFIDLYMSRAMPVTQEISNKYFLNK